MGLSRIVGALLVLTGACWLLVTVVFLGFLFSPMCDTGAGCQQAPVGYTLIQAALAVTGASAGFSAARVLWSGLERRQRRRLAAPLALALACAIAWTLLLVMEAAD